MDIRGLLIDSPAPSSALNTTNAVHVDTAAAIKGLDRYDASEGPSEVDNDLQGLDRHNESRKLNIVPIAQPSASRGHDGTPFDVLILAPPLRTQREM